MVSMSVSTSARRSFMTGIGAALAALGVGRGTASAQAAGPFTPLKHPEDDWYDARPAKHRTIIDAASAGSPPDAFRFAGNLFTANASGYGLKDEDLAIIIVLRHSATMFGFNDAIWAKYGEAIARRGNLVDPDTKQPPKRNIYRLAAGQEARGNTIDSLARRGVMFAVCGTATRGLAGAIATATSGNQDAIYKEITADPIPNGRFVPAGVLAVNRAQERGYSLIYAG
jgi:intracellular sulfur oxidation DsrE/DsrF family protein